MATLVATWRGLLLGVVGAAASNHVLQASGAQQVSTAPGRQHALRTVVAGEVVRHHAPKAAAVGRRLGLRAKGAQAAAAAVPVAMAKAACLHARQALQELILALKKAVGETAAPGEGGSPHQLLALVAAGSQAPPCPTLAAAAAATTVTGRAWTPHAPHWGAVASRAAEKAPREHCSSHHLPAPQAWRCAAVRPPCPAGALAAGVGVGYLGGPAVAVLKTALPRHRSLAAIVALAMATQAL